jgi:hypothetical protein
VQRQGAGAAGPGSGAALALARTWAFAAWSLGIVIGLASGRLEPRLC